MSIKNELLNISQANPVSGIVVGCMDDLTVENNDWGASGVPHRQVIHSALVERPDVGICGWEWEYPELPEGKVLAYPEVIWGKKPWAEASTTRRLPQPIYDAYGLEADFCVRAEATGIYNLAFDLWLTETKDAVPNGRAELMVWLYAQGDCRPAGGQIGSDALYDVFFGVTNEGSTCVTYKSKKLMNGGILPLGSILRDAVERKLFTRERFLASVELGTEIWCGKGAAIVDHLEYRGL